MQCCTCYKCLQQLSYCQCVTTIIAGVAGPIRWSSFPSKLHGRCGLKWTTSMWHRQHRPVPRTSMWIQGSSSPCRYTCTMKLPWQQSPDLLLFQVLYANTSAHRPEFATKEHTMQAAHGMHYRTRTSVDELCVFVEHTCGSVFFQTMPDEQLCCL